MTRRGPAAIVSVLGMLCTSACAAPTDEACPSARLLYDGGCCAPWAVADLDVCVLASFATPRSEDAIGAPGARDPEVAVDADGRVLVAWMQASGGVTAITVAEQRPDDTFAYQGPGGTLRGQGTSPSLATDAYGRALLSWRQQHGEDGEIFYSERGEDGAWSHPPSTPQVSYGPRAYEPRSVYGADGETLIVFNQWTGEHYGVAIARRAADARTAPLSRPASASDVVSPPVLFANAPIPAVASNGDAVIAWYQSPGGPLMTFVSERFGPNGTFSRPAADAFISADGFPVDSHPESNPTPAIHSHGSAVVVWTQEDGHGNSPVFLASRDGFGTWSLPAGLDDAFSTPAGAARCVQPAFGSDGSLYVTWYEQAPDSRLRVLAAHRAPDGEWIEHGRDTVLLSDPNADAIHPVVAVGEEGQALVAYLERTGERWDLVVRRRNPGAAAWLSPETLSADLDGDASEPAIAHRDGHFVVAWVHGPPGAGRVHLARP